MTLVDQLQSVVDSLRNAEQPEKNGWLSIEFQPLAGEMLREEAIKQMSGVLDVCCVPHDGMTSRDLTAQATRMMMIVRDRLRASTDVDKVQPVSDLYENVDDVCEGMAHILHQLLGLAHE